MWDFTFNYWGLGVAIFLMLFSLIIQFVYSANVKYKYRNYESSIKASGAKNAKNILDEKGIKAYYKERNHYFQNVVDIKRGVIRLDHHSFIHSKIEDQVNSVYAAYKYMIAKQKGYDFVSQRYIVNIISGFFCINLLWTLFVGAWILVAIFGAITLIAQLYWIIRNFKLDRQAADMAWEQLRVTTRFEIQYLILKNMKYKKIDSLKNFAIVFSAPLFSLFDLFKNWGTDE